MHYRPYAIHLAPLGNAVKDINPLLNYPGGLHL
jgi:hypothetical protein